MQQRNGQNHYPIVGYFNMPLLVIDRSHKQKFSKDMGDRTTKLISSICSSHIFVYPYSQYFCVLISEELNKLPLNIIFGHNRCQ